jgi:hypothetical protein
MYNSGYVVNLRLRDSGFAKAKTYGSYGSGCGSGSFLSDGFIRGMTRTSMEFDVALSFLFVNSFKLSSKRFHSGKRYFFLSRKVQGKNYQTCET